MKTGLLLSGGMDSAAIAWWRKPDVAFTIDYGQLAADAEITAAKQICRVLDIHHIVMYFDARSYGSGDMAGGGAIELAPATDWWPYRNQLLITLAAMKAISVGVQRLLLGIVESDCSHLDGTPGFVKKISQLMSYQEGGLLIEAPAIAMSTAQLVRTSGMPNKTLAWTHSCHKANVPCGNCRGCNKHLDVLREIYGDVDASR